MRKTILASVIWLMGCVVAHANTIITKYSYTGDVFTNFHGADACPPECRISGFFVIAGPPPKNLSGLGGQFQFDVQPLTYSFSDGSITATPANSNFDFFSVSTNTTGHITSWDIRIFTPPYLGGTFAGTQLLTSNVEDITIDAPAAVDFAASLQSEGRWRVSIGPSVPELSTWAMLLIGFAAIGLVSWRRTRARPPRTHGIPQYAVWLATIEDCDPLGIPPTTS